MGTLAIRWAADSVDNQAGGWATDPVAAELVAAELVDGDSDGVDAVTGNRIGAESWVPPLTKPPQCMAPNLTVASFLVASYLGPDTP